MPRPPALPKPPAIVAELAAFSETVRDVPYAELPKAYADAGFVWRLRENEVLLGPDASAVVRCDFLVGRGWDALQVLDTVTIRLPSGVGPLSVAARVQLQPTLIFLVCGRLPEQVAAPAASPASVQAAAETVVEMNDRDVELDARGAPVVEPWVPGVAPAAGEGLKVVDHLESDGVPVFGDLYAVPGQTRDVINAVLNEIEAFLGRASSLEEVDAVALKNPEMKVFLRDLGSPEDLAEVQALVAARRKEISVQAATGVVRRRRAAADTMVN